MNIEETRERMQRRIEAAENDREAYRLEAEKEWALRAKMEEERDGAIAYLDRLSRAIETCMSDDSRAFCFTSDDFIELERALNATYPASLTRRDLLKQAECAEDIAKMVDGLGANKHIIGNITGYALACRHRAQELGQ